MLTTTTLKVNQRASSRPRMEGMDTNTEGTTELEKLQVEAVTGKQKTHIDTRGRAVKKEKPVGVRKTHIKKKFFFLVVGPLRV